MPHGQWLNLSKLFPCLSLLTVLVFIFGCDHAPTQMQPESKMKSIQRIVSLTPSLTEVIYALEVDERLVGVTSFCRYPVEAQSKAKVGGLLNPNIEAILSLNPDLAILTPENQGNRERLIDLGIQVEVIPHHQLLDIPRSYRTLGKLLKIEGRAKKLADEFENQLLKFSQSVSQFKRPKVLICVGRSHNDGNLENLFVAGRKTFYHELIEKAGGVNVFPDSEVRYPTISLEGLLRLDPEVIIDLVPDIKSVGRDEESVLSDWMLAESLSAVKNKRVHIFTESYISIPGPRILKLLEDLIEVLHPTRKKGVAMTTPSNFVALQVDHLSLQLEGNEILSDVSFQLQKGESCSLIGPNGAGKTTLLKCLLGIYRATQGSVQIFGVEQKDLSQREIALRLAYVPQGIHNDIGFSVREFVSFSRYPHLGSWGRLSENDEQIIDDSLKATHTKSLSERSFESLSGGEKQKVLIASALAQEAEILLLDEPTSHLDYRHQVEVQALLENLQKEKGLTLLKVTHQLNPMLFSIDHVLALSEGELVFSGEPHDLLKDGQLEKIYKTSFEVIEHPKINGPILVPKGPQG